MVCDERTGPVELRAVWVNVYECDRRRVTHPQTHSGDVSCWRSSDPWPCTSLSRDARSRLPWILRTTIILRRPVETDEISMPDQIETRRWQMRRINKRYAKRGTMREHRELRDGLRRIEKTETYYTRRLYTKEIRHELGELTDKAPHLEYVHSEKGGENGRGKNEDWV